MGPHLHSNLKQNETMDFWILVFRVSGCQSLHFLLLSLHFLQFRTHRMADSVYTDQTDVLHFGHQDILERPGNEDADCAENSLEQY